MEIIKSIEKKKSREGKRVIYLKQGDFNCSSLPAGLGGNGEFERKFDEMGSTREKERERVRAKNGVLH